MTIKDHRLRIFIVRHGQTDHNVQKILQGQLDTPMNSTGYSQSKLLGQRFSNLTIDKFVTSDLERCQETLRCILEQQPGDLNTNSGATPTLDSSTSSTTLSNLSNSSNLVVKNTTGPCAEQDSVKTASQQEFSNHENSIPESNKKNTFTLQLVSSHPKVKITPNLRERNMGIVQGMYLKDALAQYGPNFRNYGESESELCTRVWIEFQQLIAASDDGIEYALMCTHGGVITRFFNYLHETLGFKLEEGMSKDDLKVPFNTSVLIVDIDRYHGEGMIRKFGCTKHLGGEFQVEDQLLR
ncbi:conserved hypothetical protein [Lodderomyces elongisporus NRRL YB-4239]|uniref:Phosphoglycerate mutase n=1 Tax=Lodderomyces elongisporus (strain ATCC 11503 / CBS 2605 / JCM 1781 / NBRC 1676 / NRRL YB-4239) TaxID=379508 RepID=A5DVU1_LODEL|nr:conserved hypothetical protein [Lodderomyces elongisporus NRRL YB-4239]